MTDLTDAELERYSRQLVLPEWSESAQSALRSASVLVVGAGALGSPAALYLAAAGVGRLGIVDDEAVELSNLQRQILHFTPDVGVPKAQSAVSKLRFLNPEVVVDAYPARLEEENAEIMVAGADVIVDCSDSFETRYVVNAACCRAGIALVEGGALGLSGLVMAIRPRQSACYRCAFPTAPPPEQRGSCAELGIVGPVAGVIGSLQALEAIKLLTGLGEPLTDRILQFDAARVDFTLVRTDRNPDCADCGGSTL